MIKTINGKVHGRTIELTEDLGMLDGQDVRVQVTAVSAIPTIPNRLVQSAGLLANEWTEEDDCILKEIRQDRKRDTRPEIAECTFCSTPIPVRLT